MLSLTVKTSKTYKVTVAEDYSYFSERVLPVIHGAKIAIVADSKAFGLHGEEFLSLLDGEKIYIHEIEQGEKSKNLENFGLLLNALAEEGFTRKDALVTFGGGMVGDLGAFAAASYMRGIKLVAVPTTLLAAVDSSVGGKTAINLKKGKNLCGAFYQPNAVYVNLSLLKTLPPEQKESGMGEVVKYSFIGGKKVFETSGEISERLVYECLKIKAGFVRADERENGKRKLLNFGHTVGHAIERLSDFTVPHGVCVAKGINYALNLSRAYFGIEKERFAPLYDRLRGFADLSCGYDAKRLAEVIASDKKSDGECVEFVLINPKLKAVTVKIPVARTEEFIKSGEEL